MESTPIKQIATSGVQIFTVDYADIATLVACAASEEQAEWLGWSLGRAHNVEHVKVGGNLRLMAIPIEPPPTV
jgi:hypothetical protein